MFISRKKYRELKYKAKKLDKASFQSSERLYEDNKELYTTSTVFARNQPYEVQVSFLLSYSDWCKLQSLDCWKDVQLHLRQYQDKGNDLFHREFE